MNISADIDMQDATIFLMVYSRYTFGGCTASRGRNACILTDTHSFWLIVRAVMAGQKTKDACKTYSEPL
jgi:hypothetical protein